MITLRDLGVFALGASLASMQVSACGEKERAPLAEDVVGQGADIPTERLPETTDGFVERPCWTKVPDYEEQCGVVTVPESPGSEETVELGVIRIFSKAESPQPDPLVYLDGGPGNATVRAVDVAFRYFEPFLEDRDLIFFDQRGTGVSRPKLSCGGSEDLSECFERLSETIDLDAYDSAQNARDLDAIRQALGYEAWNLLGISYGTRLALTAARDFPAGVRALVIDAVVPLEVDLLANLARNAQSAFEIAFAACQAEDECRDKYPNSMAQLETVFTTLTEEPLELEDTALTGSDFVAVLFNLLYSPVALGYVPLIIDAAAEGNFDVLQDLSANLSAGDFSLAMHLSVQCAEEAPFTSREAIASAEEAVRPAIRAGTTGLDYLDHCEDFPVPPAPARENQAVHSALPTLVFAGKFDPITPPSYSELAHQSLPNSFSFLIENESHGSSLGECGQSLVSSFLSDPTVEPSSTCLSGLPPPSFEGQRVSDRARRIGAAPRFATHSPSKEQIQAVRDDLEMRLHL